MIDLPDLPSWSVSSLSPILVIENLAHGLFRNVGIFPIADIGLLDSCKSAEANARATLAAAAPDLARALVAACHALRSYQYGNAAPDLAAAIAEDGEAVLTALRQVFALLEVQNYA